MKSLTGAVILGLAGMMAGCANTLGGAAKDTAADTAAVRDTTVHAATAVKNTTAHAAAATAAAAANAGHDVHMAAKSVTGATVVTPEVKTAMIRDPVLNNPGNQINVESKDGVVHLRGHVLSASMKQRATEDAQASLTKHHHSDTVQNDLTVSGK